MQKLKQKFLRNIEIVEIDTAKNKTTKPIHYSRRSGENIAAECATLNQNPENRFAIVLRN